MKKSHNKTQIVKINKPIGVKSTKLNKLSKSTKLKQTIVYIDIKINNKPLGRLQILLYYDIVPKTSKNFIMLCKNKNYVGTLFHRIIKDFMIQGGDCGSHFKFNDENFIMKHNKPYLLSMANSGPNTNGTQFFITTNPAPHLDGKHVVFGEIININKKTLNLLNVLNNVDTNGEDKPINSIVISDCGIVA